MKKIMQRILAGVLAAGMLLTSGSFSPIRAEEQTFTWRQTTAERFLYYDEESIAAIGQRFQNETVDEILQMAADPEVEVDFEKFFNGTIFEGCGLEELQWFQEEGYELQDLIVQTGSSGYSHVFHYLFGISSFAAYKPLVTHQTSDTSSKSYIAELNYAKKFWTETLYATPGGTEHISFCLDRTLHLQNGATYTYEAEGPSYAGRAINWYLSQSHSAGDTGIDAAYEYAQIYIWIQQEVEKGNISSSGAKEAFARAYTEHVYSLTRMSTTSLSDSAAMTYCKNEVTSAISTHSYPTYGWYSNGLSYYTSIHNTTPVACYMYEPGDTSYYQTLVTGYREPIPPGAAKLQKGSTRPEISDGDNAYSYTGAVYNVYSDSALTNPVGSLTTTADGSSNTIELEPGTYYVKETTAPRGFRLNETVYTVTVTSGNTALVEAYDEPQTGFFQLKKVSGNTDITDGNSCYTLAGAVYGIYTDPACTNQKKSVTTAADGTAPVIELPIGTYYVREDHAPDGFELDTTVHTITITDGNTERLTSTDMPANDPYAITINKIDAQTGAIITEAQGMASLEGAQFTVYYYDDVTLELSGLPADLETSGYVRKWVIETKFDNFTNTYKAILDGDHLVSGSPFYLENGLAVLPIGTIVITETRAPEGYLIEGNTFTSADGSATSSTNRYLAHITQNGMGDDASVNVGNIAIQNEQIIRGGVAIKKYDAERNEAEPQGKATLGSAQYGIYSNNAAPVMVGGVMYNRDDFLYTLTTAEDGTAQTAADLFPYGDYYIKEIAAPEGYRLNTEKVYFSIRTNGDIVPQTSGSIKDYVIRGGVAIKKYDAERNEAAPQGKASLAGAQYIIVSKNDNPVLVDGVLYNRNETVATLITAEDGTAQTTADLLPYGDYYLQETVAPEGYLVNSEHIDFSITTDGSIVPLTSGREKDYVIRGGVAIKKYDAERNEAAPQGKASLAGAQYIIVSKNDNPVLVNDVLYNRNETVAMLTTAADGTAQTTADLLPYGDYYLKETVAPEGYLLNSEQLDFSVTEHGTIVQLTDGRVKDSVIRGGVSVKKYDAERNEAEEQGGASLAGAQYIIVSTNDNPVLVDGTLYSRNETVATLTTIADGTAQTTADLLPYGDYYLKETVAPEGYLLNSEQLDFSVNTDGTIVPLTSGNVKDSVIRGGVALRKHDAETGTAVPQADASLAGAQYIIVSKNSSSVLVDGVWYNRNETVAALTTAEDGTAQTSADLLPYGDYYVQETVAPEGYLLNSEKIDFSITTDGTIVQLTSGQVKDTVKKQAFSLIKISSNGSLGETEVVSGAEFTVKLASEIATAGWDAARTYDVLTTDASGFAVSDELPYGTYTVRETITPPNMGTCPDFTVVVTEDNRRPQTWRVLNDAPYEAYVRIIKKDATTGENVLAEGTTFKIRNTDTGAYVSQKVGNHRVDTFVTDEDGIAATPLKLKSGHYEVVEISVPDGYTLLTQTIPFTITNNGAVQVETDEDGDPLIVLTAVNEEVTGKVTIRKHGEVLSGVRRTTLYHRMVDSIIRLLGGTADENITFVYEDAPLPGAIFKLVADEDIFTPDMQTGENGERTLATYNGIPLAEGTIAATVTTGADGTAVIEGLPLGKYHVEEVTAPDGFLICEDTDAFELAYENDRVPVITYESSFGNDRVKTDIRLVKKGEKTQNPVAGAVYGLYNEADIVSAGGTVLLSAGSLIEKQTTDADGALAFEADLPLGAYYVKEISVPEGYLLDDTKYPLSMDYAGQDVPVIEAALAVTDEETELHVSKKDITNGRELPGAHLQIIDAEGNVYEEWTSTEEAHVICAISEGSYMLHEDLTPAGYATASDVEFTVTATAEVQTVSMTDDIIKLSVSKKDITTGEELPGAKLSILDAAGNVYEEWTSTDEPHVITHIPVGDYVLREDLAPLGYVKATDITFTVTDTADVQKVEMKDDYTKVSISKQDITTKEELPGAKLQILDEEGEIYEEWISTEEPHVLERMPQGTYTLHEDLAPLGYLKATDITFAVTETAELQKVIMKDDYTKVTISKQDITTEEELPGAKLQILDEEGEIYEEWISTDEPHVLHRMPQGTYTLHEDLAPLGYVKASDITFTVADSAEIQPVVMKDDYTKVTVSKKDAATGEELAGARLQLLDKDGKVYAEWTSTGEPHTLSRMPQGRYTLVETGAPEGYMTAESIVFDVTDTAEVQVVTMYDSLIPVVETGDSNDVWAFGALTGMGLVLLLASILGKKARKQYKNK